MEDRKLIISSSRNCLFNGSATKTLPDSLLMAIKSTHSSLFYNAVKYSLQVVQQLHRVKHSPVKSRGKNACSKHSLS